MPRIIEVDGVEVDTEPEKPQKLARHRRRFSAPARVALGETERQRLERGVKTIVGKLWDYGVGEGDDVDRALRMIDKARKKEDP